MSAIQQVLAGIVGPPPTLIFGGYLRQATGSASPSFANMPYGADPSPTRVVTACIIGYGPPTGVATAVTIGGVSATIRRNSRNANGTIVTIADAVIPNGTSGTVQITYPSATSSTGAQCWTYGIDGMIDATSPQSFIDTASPFNQAVTCDKNSAIIALGTWYQTGGSPTGSWSGTSGISVDSQQGPNGGAGIGSVASVLTSSALSGATVIWTPNSTNAAQMIGVVYT